MSDTRLVTSQSRTAPRHRRCSSLAVPALVVLAAEPLYLLVDTAVVGHLGTVPLGGLAVGGGLLAWAAGLLNFLAYGTTARAARRAGAGDRAGAVAEGVQATWLALGLGLAVLAAFQVLAGPLTELLAGGPGPVAAAGEQWLRIACLGVPLLLVSLAGNGWLRGVQELRRPVRYVLAGSLVSVVLCPLLVYPAGLGLAGSAVANVAGQAVAAALFLRALAREGGAGVPGRPRCAPAGHRPRPAAAGRRPAGVLPGRRRGRGAGRHGSARRPPDRPAALLLPRPGARRLRDRRPDPGGAGARAVAAGGRPGDGPACGALGPRHRARSSGVLLSCCGASCCRCSPTTPPCSTRPRSRGGSSPACSRSPASSSPSTGCSWAPATSRYLRTVTIGVGACVGFLPLSLLAAAARLGLAGVWTGLSLFIALRLVGVLARVAGDRWLSGA